MGDHLLALQERGVVTLHERSVPGSRATIDHVAVGPAGVFVIDAGSSSRTVGCHGGHGASRRREVLRCIPVRNRTRAVEAVRARVALVRRMLDPAGRAAVPVRGIVTDSVTSRRPLPAGPRRSGDVRICTLSMVTLAVGSGGPLTPGDVRDLAAVLRDALPPAVTSRTA